MAYLQGSIGERGTKRFIDFEWVSASHEGGRRVPIVSFLGRDDPGHQDIGENPATYSIEALVSGVDWLDRLQKLEDELRRPGVKTLLHPMKRTVDVRIIRWRWTQRSNIEQSSTVSIEFVRIEDEFPVVQDVPEVSAKQVATAQAAVETDAGSRWNLQNPIDTFAKAAVSKLRAANTALLTTKGRINAQFAVVDQLAFAIQDLDDSLTSLLNAPKEIAGRFSNLAIQVFGLVETGTTSERQSAPRLIVEAVRDIAQFGSDDSDRLLTTPQRIDHDDTMRAINDDIRAFALIGAAQALSLVEYDSAATAADVRSDMADLFDGVLESSEMTAEAYEALSELFASLSLFLTDRVQNLPAVTTYTPPETTSATLIAHELYGDATRSEDIVNRNNIPCPNFVPGGIPLEVLAV